MRGRRARAAVAALLLGVAPGALARELPAPRQPIIASGTVEVAFSPWDDSEGLILRAIASARQAIYVQAYVFTSKRLARALIAARERGVQVELIADHDKTLEGANHQLPRLVAAGVVVHLDFRYAAAHNKVMLVDPQSAQPTVITGSYNFTYSARSRNAENVLALRGNRDLAQAYLRNWQRHRDGAVPWAQRGPGAPARSGGR